MSGATPLRPRAISPRTFTLACVPLLLVGAVAASGPASAGLGTGGASLTGTYEASCLDGKQNGQETGVDCGGGCGPCPCTTDADCGAGFCHPLRGDCLRPTCLDGYANGDEEGIDCGGGCAPCSCADDAECPGGLCVEGACTHDADGDGLCDRVEAYGDNPTDPFAPDTDQDGLCDGPNEVGGVCYAGEDLDADGQLDAGETDPNEPDAHFGVEIGSVEAGLGVDPEVGVSCSGGGAGGPVAVGFALLLLGAVRRRSGRV